MTEENRLSVKQKKNDHAKIGDVFILASCSTDYKKIGAVCSLTL